MKLQSKIDDQVAEKSKEEDIPVELNHSWTPVIKEVDCLAYHLFPSGLLIVNLLDENRMSEKEIYRGEAPKTLCEAMSLMYWIGVKHGYRLLGAESVDFFRFLAEDLYGFEDETWHKRWPFGEKYAPQK